MNIDLKGQVALVTGGSRGIGREICLSLARAGAQVVLNYNKSKEKAESVLKEIEGFNAKAAIFQADVSVVEQVEALFDYIRSKFGTLNILVNNAGIIKDNLLLAMRLSEWDKVLDTNLRGTFLCTQRAAEMMMTSHAGKIINISSISAVKGGKGQVNYASAKGGVVSFTRACAVELAGKGIQVNAVLPGMVITDMTSRVRKRASDAILERIPANRFGEPIDIANIVLFLASDRTDYITGQAICVDGGLSIS